MAKIEEDRIQAAVAKLREAAQEFRAIDSAGAHQLADKLEELALNILAYDAVGVFRTKRRIDIMLETQYGESLAQQD